MTYYDVNGTPFECTAGPSTMIDDKSMMIALATIQANQISGMSEEIKRLRSQLARFTDGMPEPKVLGFSSNNLEDFGDCNIDIETVKFLRRLADAGGEG